MFNKIFQNNKGTSIIEFTIVVFPLLFLINALWAMHSLHDMKRNVYGAMYNVLNRTNIQPFTYDSDDQFAPWPVGTVNQFVLTSIRDNLTAALQVGSSLYNLAPTVPNCRVILQYLDVDVTSSTPSIRGTATGTYTLVSNPDVTTSSVPVDQLIVTEAQNFAAYMTGKKVNAEESRVLLDADTLPQFGNLDGLPVNPIYLPYAPFFVWACEGDANIMFNLVPFSSFEFFGTYAVKR